MRTIARTRHHSFAHPFEPPRCELAAGSIRLTAEVQTKLLREPLPHQPLLNHRSDLRIIFVHHQHMTVAGNAHGR
jgi:hypothetical protein